MNKDIKILAIIPARGGSKGIPRKNLRLVGREPLVTRAVFAALNSGVIYRVVVSTEDNEIGTAIEKAGASWIRRPTDLASDQALTEPVMLHALGEVEKGGFYPDYIALIQCTSPFLSSSVIQEAVSKVVDGEFDSCITVFKPDGYEFKWRKGSDELFHPDHDIEKRPRRQDLDLPYHENGAFYITRTELFRKTNNRFGGKEAKVTAVLMSEEDSLQIDSPYHLWLADERVKYLQSNNNE